MQLTLPSSTEAGNVPEFSDWVLWCGGEKVEEARSGWTEGFSLLQYSSSFVLGQLSLFLVIRGKAGGGLQLPSALMSWSETYPC